MLRYKDRGLNGKAHRPEPAHIPEPVFQVNSQWSARLTWISTPVALSWLDALHKQRKLWRLIMGQFEFETVHSSIRRLSDPFALQGVPKKMYF